MHVRIRLVKVSQPCARGASRLSASHAGACRPPTEAGVSVESAVEPAACFFDGGVKGPSIWMQGFVAHVKPLDLRPTKYKVLKA